MEQKHRRHVSIIRSPDYYGLGLQVAMTGKEPKVFFITSVSPNSPAAQADLRVHDKIIEVNGKSTVEMSIADFIDIMKQDGEIRLIIENRSEEFPKTVNQSEPTSTMEVRPDQEKKKGLFRFFKRSANSSSRN